MDDDSKKSRCRILSIDGGGIRGLLPAKVLAELERELQKEKPGTKLHEHFDLICGTSTGAILALGIALGIPAGNLVDFYNDNASIIFPRRYFKILPRTLRALFAPMYSNKALRQKLKEAYAAANNGVSPTLHDAKTNICIPVFDGNSGRINVLKTKHHADYVRDYKLPAFEVALSSASAPVYFTPHSFEFKNEHGSGTNINMIDGGIFANNPAMIGLLEATEKLGCEFSDISLLSLGTGKSKYIIKSGWLPKRAGYWLFPRPRLLDIVLDSQAQITEEYIRFLKRALDKKGFGFDYLRVEHDLSGDLIHLNTSSRKDIRRLNALGDDLAKNHLPEIIKLVKKHS